MNEEPKQIKVKAMCIVVRNGKDVLATTHRDTVKNEDFGRLLGGHVEFRETGEEAMRREFNEELNTELENVEFLKMLENIFTYNGKPGHEVVFLYKGDLVDKSLYEMENIPVLDADAQTVWIPLEDVFSGKTKLYPEFDYKTLLN